MIRFTLLILATMAVSLFSLYPAHAMNGNALMDFAKAHDKAIEDSGAAKRDYQSDVRYRLATTEITTDETVAALDFEPETDFQTQDKDSAPWILTENENERLVSLPSRSPQQ